MSVSLVSTPKRYSPRHWSTKAWVTLPKQESSSPIVQACISSVSPDMEAAICDSPWKGNWTIPIAGDPWSASVQEVVTWSYWTWRLEINSLFSSTQEKYRTGSRSPDIELRKNNRQFILNDRTTEAKKSSLKKIKTGKFRTILDLIDITKLDQVLGSQWRRNHGTIRLKNRQTSRNFLKLIVNIFGKRIGTKGLNSLVFKFSIWIWRCSQLRNVRSERF